MFASGVNSLVLKRQSSIGKGFDDLFFQSSYFGLKTLTVSLVWQNIRDTYNRCLFNIRKLRLYKRSRSSPFCVQGNLQTCRYFCTHSHRAVVTCSTYRNDAPYHLLVRYIFLNLIEFRRGGFQFSSPHFFLLLSVFKLKTRQRFQQQTARVFFFFTPHVYYRTAFNEGGERENWMGIKQTVRGVSFERARQYKLPPAGVLYIHTHNTRHKGARERNIVWGFIKYFFPPFLHSEFRKKKNSFFFRIHLFIQTPPPPFRGAGPSWLWEIFKIPSHTSIYTPIKRKKKKDEQENLLKNEKKRKNQRLLHIQYTHGNRFHPRLCTAQPNEISRAIHAVCFPFERFPFFSLCLIYELAGKGIWVSL